MIKHVKIKGLNDKIDLDVDLHPDLNVITGRNGAGKTSILKAIWYSISGNIENLAREVRFKNICIIGDDYELEIDASVEDQHYISLKHKERFFKERYANLDDMASSQRTIERNGDVALVTGSSVFLPTFRRIEGGFQTDGEQRLIRRRVGGRFETEVVRSNGISDYLNQISGNLTVNNHSFICSISTNDIQRLVNLRHNDVAIFTSEYYKEFTEFIFETLGGADKNSLESNVDALKMIREKAQNFEDKRKKIMAPFDGINRQCEDMLRHKGIQISKMFTLGNSLDAIDSKLLSAGEKQMLSFICYNAFNSGCSFFIDEPELSLHVDWQRRLVPMLQSQSTSNQFILATHSPFIYSKYKDKEININIDRGCESEDE